MPSGDANNTVVHLFDSIGGEVIAIQNGDALDKYNKAERDENGNLIYFKIGISDTNDYRYIRIQFAGVGENPIITVDSVFE